MFYSHTKDIQSKSLCSPTDDDI